MTGSSSRRVRLCCGETGRRVLRGGAWHNNTNNVRASNRNNTSPSNTNNNIGFRCAQVSALPKRYDAPRPAYRLLLSGASPEPVNGQSLWECVLQPVFPVRGNPRRRDLKQLRLVDASRTPGLFLRRSCRPGPTRPLLPLLGAAPTMNAVTCAHEHAGHRSSRCQSQFVPASTACA